MPGYNVFAPWVPIALREQLVAMRTLGTDFTGSWKIGPLLRCIKQCGRASVRMFPVIVRRCAFKKCGTIPLHAPHQDLWIINIIGVSLWIGIMKLIHVDWPNSFTEDNQIVTAWRRWYISCAKKKELRCYLFFASSRPFSIVIQLMCLPNPRKKSLM